MYSRIHAYCGFQASLVQAFLHTSSVGIPLRQLGSSPTPILSAVDQIAKETIAIMHEDTLLKAEIRYRREANIAEAQELIDQKDADTQLREETRAGSSRARKAHPREQRCGALV